MNDSIKRVRREELTSRSLKVRELDMYVLTNISLQTFIIGGHYHHLAATLQSLTDNMGICFSRAITRYLTLSFYVSHGSRYLFIIFC